MQVGMDMLSLSWARRVSRGRSGAAAGPGCSRAPMRGVPVRAGTAGPGPILPRPADMAPAAAGAMARPRAFCLAGGLQIAANAGRDDGRPIPGSAPSGRMRDNTDKPILRSLRQRAGGPVAHVNFAVRNVRIDGK
jgi:hypothetical protein